MHFIVTSLSLIVLGPPHGVGLSNPTTHQPELLVTPEEAMEIVCWIVMEGDYGLVHLSYDSLWLIYACGI